MRTKRLSALFFVLMSALFLTVAMTSGARNAPLAEGDATSILAAGDDLWWLNPRPQGNDLVAVSCPTSTRCFAVSEASLLRSENGGRSWSVVPVPDNPFDEDAHTPNAFSDIRCSSKDFCLAAGYGGPGNTSWIGGSILRIRNGQASWVAHLSEPLRLIWCVDASICYAVGDETFWRSADSGDTWEARSEPPPAESMVCTGVDRCWVAGYSYVVGWWSARPHIHFTDDGGETWVEQYAPDPGNDHYGALADITCVSGSACVAVDASPAAHRVGPIVITKDGGATWTEVAVTPSGSPPPGLWQVACTANGYCYAVARVGPESGQAGIYMSSADWTSWELIEVDVPPNWRWLPWHDVACPADCLLVGSNGITLTGQGARWQPQATAPFDYERYVAIDCPSREKCVALSQGDPGVAAQLALSSFSLQGGITVTLPAALRSTNVFDTFALSCPAADRCYTAATVDDRLFVAKSEDGGNTWDTIFSPDGIRGSAAIDCPSATVCVIATATDEAEDVFVTRDGGDTWESHTLGLMPEDISRQLTGVDCANVDVCTVVGPGIMIHRTANGGADWANVRVQTSSYRDELTDVACLSEDYCVAAGSITVDPVSLTRTSLLVTRDAGESWYTIPGVTGTARAIDCSDEGLCMAVGARIYSSNAAGDHWYRHKLAVGSALNDVVCLGRQACLVVGDDGAILGTSLTLPHRVLLPLALNLPSSGG